MNAYTAQIVYRIECEGMPTDQYEEQWRLIYADDAQRALTSAREAGKDEEATFIDRHGRSICWRMLAVKDIQQVELNNGCLLFSKVHEAEPVPAPLWSA